MKRNRIITGTLLLLAGTLLSTGCHTPELSSMKPSNPKLAVGIIASQDFISSNELSQYTSNVFNQSGVVFDIRPVNDQSKAREALSLMISNKNIDLVLTEAKYRQTVEQLVKSNETQKIGLIGIDTKYESPNVHQSNVNKEIQSFVAGYLIAESNIKDPVGVIVKDLRSIKDPEWKGLTEGIHFAGSLAVPNVITLDNVMKDTGLEALKSLPARVMVLMDPVDDNQLARLHASGKWLFSLNDLPKMYPSVIAKPRPFFAEGVQEQVQALLNSSWQGDAASSVMGQTFFDILRPDTLTGVTDHKKYVEDGLKNHSILPDSYLNPPKSDKQP